MQIPIFYSQPVRAFTFFFFFFFLAKVTPVDVKSNHVQDLFDQIFMLVRLNDAEQRKYKGKKVGFSFDVLL